MRRFLFAVLLGWILFFTYNEHADAAALSGKDTLIAYPEYDARIPKCYDYGVTVHQGDKSERLHVYNRNANGEQMSNRCFQPDFNRRFCEFAFSGEVRVDIEVYRDFTSYSILPSAKEYRNEYHDGVISVWLTENDTNFMIRLDDRDDTILSVFADAPEEYEYDPNDPSVLYVGEKWYDPNGSELIYNVPENIKTIYIAPGCVLYSRLLIKTNDVTVCGHGILVDPYSDYYDPQSIGVDNYRMVVRVEGSNITLKDFKMIDTQNWNIFLYDGMNHSIYDVKILTARITTDAVAVGSGNVEIENCVFYVSDNVFTYNGYKGYHHIKNCLIGTTCAAFFPQHESKYEIDFTDIYVFRANEGIINNWYNPASHQSEIKHITFENLDCVDVVNTPWIFNAHDMGEADKYFTFRNCHFSNIRGDSNIESWNGRENQAIYVVNEPGLMQCSGYRMEFFDCTIDGKPITSPEDFHPQMAEGDITFFIQNDQAPQKRADRIKTVNYVYNKKVMIADYQLPLKNQPIEENGSVFLPEQELCKALGVRVNPSTNGIIRNAVKYVSLETVTQFYTQAAYDTEKKSICINAIPNLQMNLLEESSYTSRFNPYAYPNVILGPFVAANGEVLLRCDVNSNVNYAGMFTDITDELKKFGPDVYTISFDAKSTDGKTYAGQIWLDNIQYEGYREIDQRVKEYFVATGEWTHIEVQVDLSKWDTSDASLEFLRICSANTPGYDVLFKNIRMVKTNAVEEPDYEEGKTCRIVGINASVIEDGNFGLHYYIDFGSCKEVSVQWRFGAENAFQEFTEDSISYDEQAGLHCYTVRVNAGDLTEEIAIKVMSGDEVLAETAGSMEEYMKALLADKAYAEYHSFVKAVLNYGAAAQGYFGRNTDKPANGGLTESDRAVPAIPAAVLEAYKDVPAVQIDGLSYYGSSLLLQDHIVLRHYFTLGGNDSIEKYRFFVNDKALTCKRSGEVFYVDIDASVFAIQTAFELKIEKNGRESLLRYSPMHYVYKVETDSEAVAELKQIMHAIYQLSQEAKTVLTCIR